MSGRQLFVSTSGSDKNAGTADAPFRTIQAAADAATPGTTVHVAPGTYNETISSSVNGTADEPIRFVSDVKWGAKIAPEGASGALWTASGDYTTIDGFEVDGSQSPASRHGILFHGTETYVTNNNVHNIVMNGAKDGTGGAGIDADGSYYGDHDQFIIGNVVHDIGGGVGMSDHRVHGIYHATQGGAIENNLVYANPQGINTWHNARDLDISNNTVFNNENSGILVGAGDQHGTSIPADHMQVLNNISYDNGVGIDESGLTGTNNVYQDNLVFKNGTDWSLQNGNTAQGTISADPQFVNYLRDGGGDYHLQAGSPAIDHGTAVNAPTVDITGAKRPFGTAPDIGAFEWRP